MRIALTYNERRSATVDQAEFDTPATIAHLAETLASLGHAVTTVDVTGSIPALCDRLARAAPELVFNIAEGERGRFREAFYPALFEQLGLRHTGSSASTLAVCLDKALAKRVVAGAGVAVAEGCFVRHPDEVDCREPGARWIVKPNFEGASKGITRDSIACSRDEVLAIARAMLRDYPDGVIVERFVDGIDVSVAWIEGIGLLPPIAYRYASDRAIYDYDLKHVEQSRVRPEIPARICELTARRLAIEARRSFDALGVAGLGRLDMRLAPGGELVFLELNPLPSLGDGEIFVAAAQIGVSASQALQHVIAAASPRMVRRSRL